MLFNSQHRAMQRRRWAQQRAAHRRFLASDIWLERIGTAVVLLALVWACAYGLPWLSQHRPFLSMGAEAFR